MEAEEAEQELLLHPDELRAVVYEYVGWILAKRGNHTSEDVGVDELPQDLRKEVDKVVSLGDEFLLKARVFDNIDTLLCRADDSVFVREPREPPDGRVQALNLHRTRKAANSALRKILKANTQISDSKSGKVHSKSDGVARTSEAYEHKGRRQTMEDEVIMVDDMEKELLADRSPTSQRHSTSMYGVFDGHAGKEASAYSKQHLAFEIARSDKFKTDIEGAIVEGFKRCDALFCAKAEREEIASGSTACVVLIRGPTLHVAWVGDSQGMIIRNGKAIQLNEPHRPDRADERKRIEDSGGIVVWYGTWRVNGRLAVSRAIGDVANKEHVIGTPSCDVMTLDGSETLLILSCDGLWDVLKVDDCAVFVQKYCKQNQGKCVGLAKALCDHAYSLNSTDNVSTVVVNLGHT